MDESLGYRYQEHIHRFAAWAAARAASTKTVRFSVAEGKSWIETLPSLRACAGNPNALPAPELFDAMHRQWREKICSVAGDRKLTHGIAAKLINLYIKAAISGPDFLDHPNMKVAHPVIDRLLIDELAREIPEIWRGQKRAWSTFSSEQYEDVILKVRSSVLPGDGLWTIEKYWPGNQ